MFDADSIRAHVEGKFAAADLERFPFPHLLIEGFFPDEVFAAILRENPFKQNVGTPWIDADRSKQLKTGTPYYARKQINFHTNNKFNASEQGQELWRQIRALFLDDDWFPRLVYDKYQEYFVLRFGEAVERPDFLKLFRRQLFLQRHEPGYSIGPHTDVPTRVFTCIFSFADREGFEEFGTELCVPKDPMERCWGNNHYRPDRFDVRKVAPYRPNGFLLFFKTRQSFHAVRAIDDTVPNQRYGMQFQFYEPGRGLFQDLSEPMLLVGRHAKPRGEAKQAEPQPVHDQKTKTRASGKNISRVRRAVRRLRKLRSRLMQL